MEDRGENMTGKKITKQDALAVGVGVLIDGVLEFLKRLGNIQRNYDTETLRDAQEREDEPRSQR
jgi:hypothetical protein